MAEGLQGAESTDGGAPVARVLWLVPKVEMPWLFGDNDEEGGAVDVVSVEGTAPPQAPDPSSP